MTYRKHLRKRTERFGLPEKFYRTKDQHAQAWALMDHLNHQEKTLLMLMRWGAEGVLVANAQPAVYLIRHPVHSYVSYAGGGWLKLNQIAGAAGTRDVNSDEAIDAWLTGHMHWIAHALAALTAHGLGVGYVVRYHRMLEDWERVPLVKPDIAPWYKGSKDNWEKTGRFLDPATIDKIMHQAGSYWEQIEAL